MGFKNKEIRILLKAGKHFKTTLNAHLSVSFFLTEWEVSHQKNHPRLIFQYLFVFKFCSLIEYATSLSISNAKTLKLNFY